MTILKIGDLPPQTKTTFEELTAHLPDAKATADAREVSWQTALNNHRQQSQTVSLRRINGMGKLKEVFHMINTIRYNSGVAISTEKKADSLPACHNPKVMNNPLMTDSTK